MAISEIEIVESRAEEPVREWTAKDYLLWSVISGVAIYALFRGFVWLMNYATIG